MVLTLSKSKQRGDLGETLAKHYLQQHGVTIVDENVACRQGEIDLIGQHNNTLIFIEVRLRTNLRYGQASETVDWKKQQKLITAAHYYLQKKQLTHQTHCRFDVIGISPQRPMQTLTHNPDDYHIQWIQNAFDA